MSEQTDPLAQLIGRALHEASGYIAIHGVKYAADAIRAAVLADPTIVGMERTCLTCGNEDDIYADHCQACGPDEDLAYRTPEVKG